jgi:lactate dehydrogenase-like 2-hydroxyacid dehydrogenase
VCPLAGQLAVTPSTSGFMQVVAGQSSFIEARVGLSLSAAARKKGPQMAKPGLLMIGAYPRWDMDVLDKDYVVYRSWEAADPAAFIAAVGSDVRAVGTRGDLTVPRSVMDSLPNLEIISCFGVGVDGIDLVEANRRGIVVTNTPGVLHEEVADMALGLMLAVAHQIPKTDRFVRDGAWAKEAYPLVARMYGKRLGLIGIGAIGAAIARRCEAFRMPIAYHARSKHADKPYAYFDSPEKLAAESDFLVAACTGGAATAGLVSASVLAAMPSSSFFVNVARGSVVDEAALLDVLENKRIAGAGLDVYQNEPVINKRFFALENAVLQPHIGSGTMETRKAMGQLVRDNLAAYFAGRPVLTPVA